jgi:hypothetical protein
LVNSSTSASSSIAGALLAAAIFEYRLFHDRVIRWDLFSVVALMVVVKMSMMVWYRFND